MARSPSKEKGGFVSQGSSLLPPAQDDEKAKRELCDCHLPG